MKFLYALALPALVAAQGPYGAPAGPAPSSSSTSSAATPTPTLPNQKIITVGAQDQFMFNPSSINVAENTTVTFVFMGSFQHSVSQSTFANPCTFNGGFNSGLQAAGNEFSITITNASQPIWLYCEQTNPAGHCGMGMVGAINPPSSGSNTFSSFLNKAKALGTNEPAQSSTAFASGAASLGAFATAPAAKPSGSNTSGNNSGAERVILSASAAVAGLAAAFFTLA